MLPLPEPLLIDDTVNTPFIYPRSKHYPLSESWDNGGVALYDSSEDLLKYVWHAWTDGTTITVKRADLDAETVLITDTAITEIDLTFDQNMRPSIVYVANGVSKLYWYDSQQAAQVITEFADIKNPRVSLDDKRRFNIANSDIIFAYQRDDALCCRIQRERYSVEHVLKSSINGKRLVKIGMGVKNRFLFYVKP